MIDNDVTADIADERNRQDNKWGVQDHLDGTGVSHYDTWAADRARSLCQAAGTPKHPDTWRLILDEEVREAFAESDARRLRKELIQVAAVASAWIEAIDRRSTSHLSERSS